MSSVSMDGLRINLLQSYNRVANLLNQNTNGEITEVNSEELKELMDELQQNVGVLLCIFDNNKEDFNLLYEKYSTIEFKPE